MPILELPHSPHAGDLNPVTIYYREVGSGHPLVFLHGGWGYGVYPFDRQIEAFKNEFRILIPDRSGYGHSTRVSGEMPLDFHRRAASGNDAISGCTRDRAGSPLGSQRWSRDRGNGGAGGAGALRAANPGSLPFSSEKAGVAFFFERFAARPEDLGEETKNLLKQDHGETQWPEVLRRNCSAWFQLADLVQRPDEDLYGGSLGELKVPTLFLHGSLDPRTEPGEMELVRRDTASGNDEIRRKRKA